MAIMKNVVEVVSSIGQADVSLDERDNRGMLVGEVAHQGDVYVWRVNKHEDIYAFHKFLGGQLPRGEKTTNRQVAPGVTPGSRHVVEGSNVLIYDPPNGHSPLEGPTIEAEEEWRLPHPEHALHRFGAGTFVVTFQREFAEEMRRVAD